MSCTYYRNDCTECCGPEPEFKSEEGREKRRTGLARYRVLSRLQACLALLAMLSGATTIGLAIPKPSYPYLSCFPFVCGVLMLVSAYFGHKASKENVDERVPMSVKRSIGIHYGLAVTCCSLCGVAVGNSAWGLGLCLASSDSDNPCTPHTDVRAAFAISDMACNFLLMLLAIVGSAMFCKYARTFGLGRPDQQRLQNLEDEVRGLRAQLASISAQAQTGQSVAPPPYSYSNPDDASFSTKYGVGQNTKY